MVDLVEMVAALHSGKHLKQSFSFVSGSRAGLLKDNGQALRVQRKDWIERHPWVL
jgi:hypothetical protein